MIASLPMYDRPMNRGAHDRLWGHIRDALRETGINAPTALDRTIRYGDSWKRRDLVLGQICVLPYRTSFSKDVTVIGASDYGLDDCAPGYFRALFVCRKDDPRDLNTLSNARFAANARHSYSGFQAAHDHMVANGQTLPSPDITGSHDESVRQVANGIADFACIDAQTWRMQQTDLPEAQSLRVLTPTAQAPGQSFITRQSHDPEPYFKAIKAAINTLSGPDKTLLSLRDIVALPASAYT